MDWRQFVMDLGPLPPAAVEEIFTRHGAHAVTLSDAGDDPVLEPGPGETPLWNSTRITGLFSPDADFAALTDEISAAFDLTDLPPHRIEELADRPWEREWLKDFRPMRFGQHLWICPRGQWPGDCADPDTTVIELDPGLAFGTGTHPTTALCLRWLDAAYARGELDGRDVLDFGCGSGVLAIAALKLGASRALAMDIDPQAVTATLSNAGDNGVADRLQATTGQPTGRYGLVLANILAAPLVELADTLCERLQTGAPLVLSGILESQADAVRAAYASRIDFEAPAIDDNWVRLAGRKR